ncbi:hypothetical protein ACFWOS_09325 [Streptomyces rubiginosohelvolus]|uniref:hypothetical protein n=1 Tax=Streptomyces rubiginosohelvolus TaxID=67362 RepID=UPI003662772D
MIHNTSEYSDADYADTRSSSMMQERAVNATDIVAQHDEIAPRAGERTVEIVHSPL